MKKKHQETWYMTNTIIALMVGGLTELIMKGRRVNIVKLSCRISLYVALK